MENETTGLPIEENQIKRRDFISRSGLLVAGVAVPSALLPNDVLVNYSEKKGKTPTPSKVITPEEMTPIKLPVIHADTEKEDAQLFTPVNPDKRIGFAIVGLGHLTLEQIMPAFGQCKFAKPVALVSGSPDKAKKLAQQYGIPEKNIYNYTNFDTIRDNPEIDVVYIVLPNNMHADYTIRAANAGKHVLCEKSMATNSQKAQSMVDACKKADRKLMIAYRMQYEPNVKQIMKWVRSKEHGTVKIIEGSNVQNSGTPDQWRLIKKMGGGALRDVGIYCLNTFRYLLGEEPESVFAMSHQPTDDPRFKETPESTMFQLRFPSGVIANCASSFGVHQSRRFRCYTDKGTWFGMDPAFDYNGLKMEFSEAKGKMEWKSNPTLGEKQQFALEMDHMAQCIINNTQPYTPGEEGLQDLKIMEAIEQSAREGKLVMLDKVTKTDAFRGPMPKED